MANTDGKPGSWSETKDKLKEKFAFLTDNDLFFTEGKKDAMLRKIQIKLGKTKDELALIIARL